MTAPSVAAVFCCYNPTVSVLSTIATAALAVARVVVVDDGSEAIRASFYSELRKFSNVEILLKPTNLGIADSVNQGISILERSGMQDYEWVVFFDQDSIFDAAFLSVIQQSAIDLAARGVAVGAVGPGIIGDMPYRRYKGAEPVSVPEIIQSGAIFSMEALRAVGGAESDLVIDCVDTDICLKLRRAGYSIFVLPDLRLDHRIGEGKFIRLLGRRVAVTYHSPQRRYYITRNRLRVLTRHGLREPAWGFVTLRRLVVGTMLAVTVESNRRKNARAIILGTYHAMQNRSGKFELTGPRAND
jgi:rhamnosyltransferase